jgi:hypothetical protein
VNHFASLRQKKRTQRKTKGPWRKTEWEQVVLLARPHSSFLSVLLCLCGERVFDLRAHRERAMESTAAIVYFVEYTIVNGPWPTSTLPSSATSDVGEV